MIPGFNYRLHIRSHKQYLPTNPAWVQSDIGDEEPTEGGHVFLEIPGNGGSKQKLKKEVPTLQGTNISHLGKRNIIFKSDF